MHCEHCGKEISPKRAAGQKGGSAITPAKARTPEQMRAVAQARWSAHNKVKAFQREMGLIPAKGRAKPSPFSADKCSPVPTLEWDFATKRMVLIGTAIQPKEIQK